jgi:hypothetical protein
MAREVGADIDPETLDRVFDKVARSSKPRPQSARGSKKSRDQSR